jgi:hypothetical protein
MFPLGRSVAVRVACFFHIFAGLAARAVIIDPAQRTGLSAPIIAKEAIAATALGAEYADMSERAQAALIGSTDPRHAVVITQATVFGATFTSTPGGKAGEIETADLTVGTVLVFLARRADRIGAGIVAIGGSAVIALGASGAQLA